MTHRAPRERDDPNEVERRARLRLARGHGVGPMTFQRLLARFGTAARALRAVAGDPRFAGLRPVDEAEALAETAAVTRLGASLLLWGDPDYPEALAAIDGAPPALAVLGDVASLVRPAVGIVGARNASGNGRAFARRLAADLADAGFVVVSGLARGIDTAAHEGALSAGGLTVAAVAGGVDVVYPPENADLTARIAGSGAVVSERPPGAEPKAKYFPARNRLIAGLSLGVVVVEAAPASGSLITARFAAEQGREVLAVPGGPGDPRHRGTNRLLRDGAHFVEEAEDVLAVLRPLAARRSPAARPTPAPAVPRAARETAAPAAPSSPPERTGGDGLAARLGDLLGLEPLAVDELVRRCDATAADVRRALSELELDGRVERHPGNRVSLAGG